MTSDKGILIKNIYCMLTYAFQALKLTQYESVAAEEFQNVQDMFAAILAKGVAKLVKQGLFREYETQCDTLAILRGKLDMAGTWRQRAQNRRGLSCEFDELSENNLFNQILKTAMSCLVRTEGVDPKRQQDLQKLLLYFHGVARLEPTSIAWSKLRYRSNNGNYELLLNVCYFVLHDLIQTTENGEHRVQAFSDEQMARLFEKFILEYYRYHYTDLDEVNSPYWKWAFADDVAAGRRELFPQLHPDVVLRRGEKTLIVDAKYYEHILAEHYSRQTFHAANLYQIFAYVQNYARGSAGSVAGVLVYAATQEVLPERLAAGELEVANIAGCDVGVLALNLNKEFAEIAGQLDVLAARWLGRHEHS